MTLLFISRREEGLGLAMRCLSEGYSVIFYTEDEEAAFVGNSLVDKPSFCKHLLNQRGECVASNVNQLLSEVKPDLVIFSGQGLGKVADYIREQKISVFSGSHWTDILSTNKEYSRDVMKRVGIERWKGEEGIRIECGFWWDGLKPSLPFIVWNENRFMTNSLGPIVGSASNIVHCFHLHSSLILESVGKMEPLLKKSKFRGILSTSVIVTKNKIYGISFTVDSPFLSSLTELYKGSLTNLLLSISNGYKIEGEMTTDYSLSLLLSIPPFPNLPSTYKKVSIKGINSSNLRHLHLFDCMRNGEGFENAGISGKLMMVSARGRDAGECKKRVMKTVSNLEIEDVQYRTDPTKRFSIEESKLQEWCYLI